jgi:hypothetical protein
MSFDTASSGDAASPAAVGVDRVGWVFDLRGGVGLPF